jgi:pimeloyl-ACP methyl ester carboxylesterase
MRNQLSLKRVLIDGTILNVLLSIIVYGSIYANPMIWGHDYPPDIQAVVGDVDIPPAQTIIFGVLLFGVVIGVVLYSNAKLRQQNGGKLSFWAAFANSALIFFYFAVWDLLILDWLIFVTIQPSFIVIPGTEGLAGYKDYWFHFKVSFLGWTQWISILVGGLVLAGLSMIRVGGARRRRASFDEIYGDVPDEQKRLLQEFRADHPYKELDVGGTRWRYIACGQGDKALLFLPGGFLAADMYFHAVLTLEKTHRIIVPDSYTLQGTFDMGDVCSAIVHILDAEGVEKATVIGLSAGGGIAQYFIQEYPQRVEHLVLSHCGILERDPEAANKLKKMHSLVKILPLFVTRRILKKMTAGTAPPSSKWIEFHNAYFREASSRITKTMFVRFLEGSIAVRRGFVFEPEVLESWAGEILILASKDDQAAYASLGKLQARYPRAQTHLFEEGGHHTFMFFPEAYIAVLREFVERSDDLSIGKS